MSHYSRRDFGRTTLGAAGSVLLSGSVFAAGKPNSKVNGVQLGVQSYSFRDRSLDEAIAGMVEAGINSCELWQGHVEPRPAREGARDASQRESLRKWRLSTPLDEFKKVRDKFNQAGIKLYAYNLSFREDFSDEEIDRGFQMARAMGVKALTASSNVTTARRIDAFAQKYRIPVGMHNHSNLRPNEFASPENFAEAMKGMSKYIAINLDIGHFVAAGFDPVSFLQEHHQHIVTLHIKDRKKNQGENTEFGKGDTPIREVLQVLKKNKYPIPANIEYEYKGADTVAEVKKCLEYCKQALA